MAIDPIPFSQSNRCLKPPEGAEARCSELDIYVHPDSPEMLSKWKLSQDEIDNINRTGVIWLWVMGTRHPPVVLTTKDPFDTKGTP